MDWLIVYIIFAITTSICAWIFFYIPAIREAKKLNVVNSFTKNPVTSSLVYLILSVLIAPTIFIAIFDSQQSNLFYEALRKEILKETE